MASQIVRLSPTRLKTYIECPRQYYFAYVRRLPRRARSYYSLGTSLHSALESFHEMGGVATQPEQQLLANLETSWVNAGYSSLQDAQENKELGQQILSTYYQSEVNKQVQTGRGPETLFLEKTLSIPQDGYILTGRIDRIDRRPDGLLEVIDYKSGSFIPSAEELWDDLAIGIYQLLSAISMNEAPVAGTVYNIRWNQSVSTVRDSCQIAEVGQHVADIFHILSGDQAYEPRPGPRCNYCDYRRWCPAIAQDQVAR